jgi:transposase
MSVVGQENDRKRSKVVDNPWLVVKACLTMRQKEIKKSCKKSVDTPDAI